MDIIKIIAVICTLIGTCIAAYKFFWKAPSEKEVKLAEHKTETIATRFTALFESHGVHRNQIPEIFGHGLDIPSCAADDELLKKLTPEIINDAVKLFGVNKDWLEGSSKEIYSIPDFYKHPEEFESYLKDLLSRNGANHMIAYCLKSEKKLSNTYNDSLIIIAEPIDELNGREIYKYHLLGHWGIHYWKSCGYFAACCALLYKHGFMVVGKIVDRNWLDKIYNGETLIKYNFEERQGGILFTSKGSWVVNDFVEMPDKYLEDMDTEQGRAISLALNLWLSLSEKGLMRCDNEGDNMHKIVEKTFRNKLNLSTELRL